MAMHGTWSRVELGTVDSMQSSMMPHPGPAHGIFGDVAIFVEGRRTIAGDREFPLRT
jgi:hypothetical protein